MAAVLSIEAIIAPLVALFRRARSLSTLILATFDSLNRPERVHPEGNLSIIRQSEEVVEETYAYVTVAIDVFVDETPERVYSEENPGAPDAGQRAVRDLLVQEITDRLAAAARDMADEAKRQLREIARRRLEAASLGEEGLGYAAEEFRRELVERGIRVRDRAGRSQDPEAYSYMVLLNGLRELRRRATLDRAVAEGAAGVLITDNEGPNSCQPCKTANGQRWSLGYYARNLSEHPNCVREAEALPSDWRGELDRA